MRSFISGCPLGVDVIFLALLIHSVTGPTAHAKVQDAVDYAYVAQVFRKYDCVDCHTDSRPASKLDLTTYEGLMTGGRRGAAVQASNADESLLIKVLSGGATPPMPPGNSHVSDEDLTTLKTWINEGAQNSDYGQIVSRYYAAKKDQSWDDAIGDANDLAALKLKGIDTEEAAARLELPVYETTKNEDGFYKASKTIVDGGLANGNIENDIAWTIVDPQGWIKKLDLDLAEKSANGAVANTQRKSGAILDTLAWVYFRQGNKDKAIATEKEAMACSDAQGATLDSLKQSMKAFGG